MMRGRAAMACFRRTIRSPSAGALIRQITLTPYARPGATDTYRRKLADLSAVFASGTPEALEAGEEIRTLVDRVVATPRATGRGVDLDLQGRRAAILRLTKEAPPPKKRRD